MAEEWLDVNARRAIRQRELALDAIEEVEMAPPTPRKVKYDESKLSVALPETEDVERIEYVPPKLQLADCQVRPGFPPRFQTPDAAFNAFEHIQYEWIDIPELE